MEEKPNKVLIRVANTTVFIGLVLWIIAIWGFCRYQSHSEESFTGYLLQALQRLKYQILDAIAGTVIIVQSFIINSTELKRVDEINKPWNVKPPTYP